MAEVRKDDGTISLCIVQIEWFRGFPPVSGMYLVELADGEHIVTPYRAEPRWVEADGDWDNKTGWTCLTHSRATVKAWARIPKGSPASDLVRQRDRLALALNMISLGADDPRGFARRVLDETGSALPTRERGGADR